MPVVLTEYQSGFQHAVNEAEHMLTIDVVHSIASFRFDPPDTDYVVFWRVWNNTINRQGGYNMITFISIVMIIWSILVIYIKSGDKY